MNYISTRGGAASVSAAEALLNGIAPDGGLYMPEYIPKLTQGDLDEIAAGAYADAALSIMKLFLSEFSDEELIQCIKEAYSRFDTVEPAPCVSLSDELMIMELWHGPTCAFKDMALQLFPRLMPICKRKLGVTDDILILTATSGDTGKAALEGFKDVPGIGVCVFYPNQGVSAVQQAQMVTQRGSNVHVAAINGNFDDAQTAVKRLFTDKSLSDELADRGVRLSSANSINFGRLLPQIIYYVYASVKHGSKSPVNFIVPSGNFGNILAGYIAQRMGAPVGRLICASNSNNVLTDFLTTGRYDVRREFYKTTSPSMDILVSSNLERLLYLETDCDTKAVYEWMAALNKDGLYQVDADVLRRIRTVFGAGCCDDAKTAESIKACWDEHHYLLDTHTAVGYRVYEQVKSDLNGLSILVSTASPFKFADSVLHALSGQAHTDFEALSALEEYTGWRLPQPIAELQSLPVRFKDTLDVDKLRGYCLGLV